MIGCSSLTCDSDVCNRARCTWDATGVHAANFASGQGGTSAGVSVEEDGVPAGWRFGRCARSNECMVVQDDRRRRYHREVCADLCADGVIVRGWARTRIMLTLDHGLVRHFVALESRDRDAQNHQERREPGR